jgi:hypothetical protein
MKKIFTLVAVAMMAVCANAQTITFTEAAAAGTLDAKTFGTGFVMTVTDTGSKCVIDANSAYFGNATTYTNYGFRFKTGGKSSTKNQLVFTIPTDGVFRFCARTGSNSDVTRNVIVTQSDTELFNKIMLESDVISVDMTDATGATVSNKVYPVNSVDVKAGTVTVTYPIGSINFYEFELATSTGIQKLTPIATSSAVCYNMAGQKVSTNAKGLVIENGKKIIK